MSLIYISLIPIWLFFSFLVLIITKENVLLALNLLCPFGVHLPVDWSLQVTLVIISIISIPPDVLLYPETSSSNNGLNPYSWIAFLVTAYTLYLSVLFSNNAMTYTSSLMVTTLKIDILLFFVKWISIYLLTHILDG